MTASPAGPPWEALLRSLAPGEWTSGARLAELLGISRTAIWKQIEQLEALGLAIDHRRGRGYRLKRRLELLAADAILGALPDQARPLLGELMVLPVVDSTNSRLMAGPDLPTGSACLAEAQTAGRGRRGRDWVSPLGGNLYCSLLWRFDEGIAAAAGLGLAIAVAAARTLESADVQARIKWPNDLLVNDAKLGGILIEATGEMDSACRVVIGIGINVDLGTPGPSLDQPWTDLRRLGADLSRNRLAGMVLGGLLQACRDFGRAGLAPFLADWQARDWLRGRQITVDTGGARVIGVATGIDARGRLEVATEAGLERFYGGEVSVRA